VDKPTETYEKIIESKVFSFLNGFFGKEKQNPLEAMGFSKE
jgi:hypothetical protein